MRKSNENQLLQTLIGEYQTLSDPCPGRLARSEKRLAHRAFSSVSSLLVISSSRSRVYLGTWAALRRTGIGERYRGQFLPL